jgi:hypothetical protein
MPDQKNVIPLKKKKILVGTGQNKFHSSLVFNEINSLLNKLGD